jgi:hypothetical protein
MKNLFETLARSLQRRRTVKPITVEALASQLSYPGPVEQGHLDEPQSRDTALPTETTL